MCEGEVIVGELLVARAQSEIRHHVLLEDFDMSVNLGQPWCEICEGCGRAGNKRILGGTDQRRQNKGRAFVSLRFVPRESREPGDRRRVLEDPAAVETRERNRRAHAP